MVSRNRGNAPRNDEELRRRFDIEPGPAKLSRDPAAPAPSEKSSLPGCDRSHATHAVANGD